MKTADIDCNADALDSRTPVTFTHAQLGTDRVRVAFEQGHAARSGSRCPATLVGAERKAWINGRNCRKVTSDIARAWTNFSAVEGFWADSAAACVQETIARCGMQVM